MLVWGSWFSHRIETSREKTCAKQQMLSRPEDVQLTKKTTTKSHFLFPLLFLNEFIDSCLKKSCLFSLMLLFTRGRNIDFCDTATSSVFLSDRQSWKTFLMCLANKREHQR